MEFTGEVPPSADGHPPARTESAMGNHQQNQQPRHEQPGQEGQRRGDNNQGGKARQAKTALDQGGQGKGSEPSPESNRGKR